MYKEALIKKLPNSYENIHQGSSNTGRESLKCEKSTENQQVIIKAS